MYQKKGSRRMRIISGTARGTKLYTLDGENTRPTLDRIKESLFNIIKNKIIDSEVLDLFAGSGAIGLEFASRGAKKVILCDSSREATKIINKNIEKTNLKEKVELKQSTSEKLLSDYKGKKFDIIFIDPPYNSQLIAKSVEKIFQNDMLSTEGIMILETDQEERILKEIKKYEENIYDIRRYGRVKLIFMRKG